MKKQRWLIVFVLLLVLSSCTSKNKPDGPDKTWDNARWNEATWR